MCFPLLLVLFTFFNPNFSKKTNHNTNKVEKYNHLLKRTPLHPGTNVKSATKTARLILLEFASKKSGNFENLWPKESLYSIGLDIEKK